MKTKTLLMPKRIARFLGDRIKAAIYPLGGLIPITALRDDDVFIVGYPRSGNSWFQNLAAGVIYGIDPRYTRFGKIYKLIPYAGKKGYYRRYHDPMCFKSHEFPEPRYKRVIYLVRDGRDVMVSYYHYNVSHWGEGVNFLDLIRGDKLLYGQWHKHVEAWLSNPYKAEMIIIKYEDLVDDTVGELRRFCGFVGIKRDDSALEAVAKQACFENLRKKEIDYGLDDSHWPKERPFFRRGIAGSYKDEMPSNIREAFLEEAGDTLKKLGYEI